MALTVKEIKLRHEIKSGRILPPGTESIIGNYKKPLTSVVNGYGFDGALTYDTNEAYTQCHMCGYFFRWLPFHIKRAHDITSAEYKDKFGLARRTSLLAARTREQAIQSSSFTHWSNEDWEAHREHLKRNGKQRSDRLTRLNQRGESQREESLEDKNKKGTCPEQLLDKIKRFADKLGRTPKRKEFIAEYGYGVNGAIRATFGGWGEALKLVGLTPNKPGKSVYDEKLLLDILKNFKEQYKREPMSCDVRTFKLPALDVYRKYFGTFTDAKKLAGVKD